MAMTSENPIWRSIHAEVSLLAAREPLIAASLRSMVLDHSTFSTSLAAILAHRLTGGYLDEAGLARLLGKVLQNDRLIEVAALQDLHAVVERDPACAGAVARPLLYFKGFQAIQAHRIAHSLHSSGRCDLALVLQARVSEVFAVDIHPSARIGAGILLDHATGVVIGETAVIGDRATILHGVTLGSTGNESGDRHPKIDSDVFLGAGSSILGNIRIGRGVKVGAGSVVTLDVPPFCTVVGVPARIVRRRSDYSTPVVPSVPNRTAANAAESGSWR